MRSLLSKLAVLFCWVFFTSLPLFGQSGAIVIQPDIRVFAVLAALQQAGLSIDDSRTHPAQASIARDLQHLPAALRGRLQKFYQDHMEGKKAEEQVAKYVSLALLSDGPPDFKLSLSPNQLPPDALSVAEFLDLVKEFYATAKLESIWSTHRWHYDQVVLDHRATINQIILLTDGYLRIASGSFLDRRLLIIPDLLAPPNTFNARTYRENYYLVFAPSGKPAADEFRHQYLHFLLDPYALRFTLPKDTRTELVKFIETATGVEESYRTDLQLLVSESLIRAVELRMNKAPEAQAGIELDAAIRSGAVLARHFYRELLTFENSPEGIKVSYPSMVKSVAVAQVQTAFSEAQKNAPVVQKKAEPRELNEVEKLLRKANVQLGANDLEGAVGEFQKVLEGHDASNGEALYGLGVVASLKNRKEIAKDYFSKALQSPSSTKSVKVWAHIYLGRLLDLEDNRNDAIQQYQSAIALGDNTRNAQEVAQRGLKEPFRAKRPGPP